MPDDMSVADRISEILKFDLEHAENAAERLRALGIRSAADSLNQLNLPELGSIGLTELEAIKLRARWTPDAGKNKMTISQEAHIRVLEECKNVLSMALVVDKELIDKLKHQCVLTEEEKDRIESASRNDVKVHELVTVLQKEGDKYQRFQRCLDQQPTVLTILKEKENSIKLARVEEDKQRTVYVLLKKIDDLSKAKEEKSEQVKTLEQDNSTLGSRIYKLENDLKKQKLELNALEERYNVALMEEVKNGNIKQFERVLDRRRNINKSFDEDGKTPLIWASSIGNLEIVRLLLSKDVKADHALRDKDGNTALHYAAKEGKIETMDMLLKAGANPNVQNSAGETPLYAAVGKHQIHAIKLLVEDHHAEVDIKNKNGCTPLFLAARMGNCTAISVLLEFRADINAERDDGSTPLYIAAEFKEKAAVEMLLDRGANTSKARRDGITPLHIAAERGGMEICEILLDHGVDVNVTKLNGATPLHSAAAGNHCDVIELLLKRGALIEAKKEDMGTPLFSAAYKGCKEAVELLLRNDAYVNRKKPDGETPLLSAIASDEYEVVRVLLEQKANIDLPYENGDTPLHVAAKRGNEKIVNFLIEKGAELKENKEGRAPAQVSKTHEIRRILEKYEKQVRGRKRAKSEGNVSPHWRRGKVDEKTHLGMSFDDSTEKPLE